MLILELLPGCEEASILKILYFIKQLFNILFILIPIILIVVLSIDMFKNIVASREEDMKKNTNIFIKRILFCVLLFLVEPIVGIAISLLGRADIDYATCLELANKDTIAELNKLEEENKEVEQEQDKLAEEQGVKEYVDEMKDTEDTTISDESNNSEDENTTNNEEINDTEDENIDNSTNTETDINNDENTEDNSDDKSINESTDETSTEDDTSNTEEDEEITDTTEDEKNDTLDEGEDSDNIIDSDNTTDDTTIDNENTTDTTEEESNKTTDDKKDDTSKDTSKDKNTSKKQTPTKSYGNSTDKPIKVLLMGNSLTYVNGYGEILTRMAKKTGKKIVVVMATRGDDAGKGRNLLKNKLNYKCWSSTTSCSNQKGTKKLTDIIKIDFANLKRQGKWDYIVLQNHWTKSSTIIDSDVAIYNTVKRNLTTSKNFVLNLTTFAKGVRSDRLEPHMKAIKKVNGSLMYTAKIFSKYDSNWTKKLLIGDGSGHQSTKGAYLFACIMYAKIYGPNNLAKSNNASNYIAIYGEDAVSQYNHRTGNTKYGAMKVTKSDAKELQALVYKYYKKYVLYY